MGLHPIFLPPTLPADLLWFIIHSCIYPTTLIVCSSRSDFLTSLTQSIPAPHQQDERNQKEPVEKKPQYSLLGAAPLYQIAIAKHIRILFMPTVSHLRAFLSVFSAEDSKVPPPPAHMDQLPPAIASTFGDKGKFPHPLLVIYGFLETHRQTSEWSAQGLSNTASILIESSKRVGFQAVVVEPRLHHASPSQGGDEGEAKTAEEKTGPEINDLLSEEVPILSGSAIRTGPDLTGSGWAGRTVNVRHVLGRWFRFRQDELGQGAI